MKPRLSGWAAIPAALISIGLSLGALGQASPPAPATTKDKSPPPATSSASTDARSTGTPSRSTTTDARATTTVGNESTSVRSSTKDGKGTTSITRSGEGAQLAKGERDFIMKVAKGGMKEVELGKLAEQKGQSEDVKSFGKRMVQDHGNSNEELKQLASSKGVTLPDTGDSVRKEVDKMAKLSGDKFDAEYRKHMVADHKKNLAEFQKQAKNARDADVKNFAAGKIPTLQEHLKMAEAMATTQKTAARDPGATGANRAAPGGTNKAAATGDTSREAANQMKGSDRKQ